MLFKERYENGFPCIGGFWRLVCQSIFLILMDSCKLFNIGKQSLFCSQAQSIWWKENKTPQDLTCQGSEGWDHRLWCWMTKSVNKLLWSLSLKEIAREGEDRAGSRRWGWGWGAWDSHGFLFYSKLLTLSIEKRWGVGVNLWGEKRNMSSCYVQNFHQNWQQFHHLKCNHFITSACSLLTIIYLSVLKAETEEEWKWIFQRTMDLSLLL